jgi:2-C-methyl-D-erythritol 4-phosphate cytidylyltransferase/2-C-methyl-D-erythritol 2,4-cyclodiphosphate synthase
MLFDAILLAGGSGLRMGHDKLLLSVGEDTVLARATEPFAARTDIRHIILVLRRDLFDVGKTIAERFGISRFRFVQGGSTRTQSVENGLAAADSQGVLIHDAARPFVNNDLIDRVAASVCRYGSGIPVLPLADSVRRVSQDVIVGMTERESLYTVQTPQGFLTEEIKKAYALREGRDYTDDSSVFAAFCGHPHIVEGDDRNIKLTTLGSYFGLNAKIGTGYDLHRLIPFRKLILGGIEVPYDKGPLAHSDGDAVIHALIDAMLSAIGEADIGTRYPNTDPRYRDIDSTVLLSDVAALYRQKNFKVSNISITIVADKPKLMDYIPLMKIKISNILDIHPSLIGIGAKTTEGTRNDESVEVYASVLIT